MMSERSLRGQVAIAGVGETRYYKHGESPHPEFRLVLMAILEACRDAGIDPRDIDGFCSYSNDRNIPARLASALGTKRLRTSLMQWGGGGGGCCAAIANAAAAIRSGQADCVVVFRGLAQGQFGRYGRAAPARTVEGEPSYEVPYGVLSPAQRFAMKARRYMHENSVGHEALRSIAMAAYHHAQSNPRAVRYGKPLDEETYDNSRWIVEPFRLFDCCMENDGAAAAVLIPAERARDFPNKPVYILGAAAGADYRAAATSHNAPNYASATFATVATDLYASARVSPADVGSVQSYENFTGGVMMALAEHGFFKPEETSDFLRLDNLLAPHGKLPLNTSGGNLAECYMHGFELIIEATRQVRGTAINQVPRNDVALVIGGPMVFPVSNLMLGSEATL